MAKSTSEPEADQRGCDGDTAVYDLIEDTLHYATANKLPLSTTYVTFMVARIEGNSSKTRLSILYYGIVGNAMMLSKQKLELLEIFALSFGEIEPTMGLAP